MTNALKILKVLFAAPYPITLVTKEPEVKMRMIAVMMGSWPKLAKRESNHLTIPRKGTSAFCENIWSDKNLSASNFIGTMPSNNPMMESPFRKCVSFCEEVSSIVSPMVDG